MSEVTVPTRTDLSEHEPVQADDCGGPPTDVEVTSPKGTTKKYTFTCPRGARFFVALWKGDPETRLRVVE